ncbi:MAG: DUF1013 domain-containing protein [Rhodobacteraceae bacterium]|nr:MAG: DUF1013 domain-containing protein [Paracoccaceae bacterium]
MALPLMQKATAVWLIDNTKLTFSQIAKFCGLHELEVNGIADGDVATGIRGMDPISNTQLTLEEIKRCEEDQTAELVLLKNPAAIGEGKRRGPRYTPLSKRQDRPAAIAWIVKFHPELTDAQISKLIGTTKPTIQSIRARTHWNMANFQPVDPVALGLCKQVELDAMVAKSSKKLDQAQSSKNDDSETTIVSTESSLIAADSKVPSNIAGLEGFSLTDVKSEEQGSIDPDSIFSLPKNDKE